MGRGTKDPKMVSKDERHMQSPIAFRTTKSFTCTHNHDHIVRLRLDISCGDKLCVDPDAGHRQEQRNAGPKREKVLSQNLAEVYEVVRKGGRVLGALKALHCKSEVKANAIASHNFCGYWLAFFVLSPPSRLW